MLTAFSDDEALLDSIMAGAAGYVLKQIRGSDLAGAVRMAASGRSLLDPRAASRAIARLRDEADQHDSLSGLTARERKVLELIGDGLTNRQIGERLSVQEKTVKNCVSVLFVKLGMEQRTQAAAYAARIFDGRKLGSGPLSGAVFPLWESVVGDRGGDRYRPGSLRSTADSRLVPAGTCGLADPPCTIRRRRPLVSATDRGRSYSAGCWLPGWGGAAGPRAVIPPARDRPLDARRCTAARTAYPAAVRDRSRTARPDAPCPYRVRPANPADPHRV